MQLTTPNFIIGHKFSIIYLYQKPLKMPYKIVYKISYIPCLYTSSFFYTNT
jgi:hypothetical protein